MAQIKILVPLVALILSGCASVSTHDAPAAELAANASRIGILASGCKGAHKTSVCERDGTCRCTDSAALLQTLGLDDAVWSGQ
jgi:hypothetical protein